MLDYPLDLLGRVMDATPLGRGSALRPGAVRRISTDSRTVERGDLFFAIQGENFDGHRFITDALRKGAAGAVAGRERVPEDALSAGVVLAVADPLLALGSLAAWHRNRFPIKVVAVTGSVGKTTTKDLVAAVLSRKFRTLKSPGNLNAEIGLPLTLFDLGPNHEVLVVEMAMRGPGQIRYLARIARPDVAVITNIGLSHMELLGSQDAIADAKAELLDFLPRGGAAVLNADDRYFDFLRSRVPPEATTVPFGLDTRDGAAVTGSYLGPAIGPAVDAGSRIGSRCVLGGVGVATPHPLTLPLLGRHNLSNALAATAVGLTLGVDWSAVIPGLESADISAMRMAVHELPEGCLLIDDAYNASSPETMLAALDVLGELPYERKTAVLGSMLELGPAAGEAHRRVGEAVAAGGIDRLVTVGEGGSRMADAALGAGMPPVRVFRCETNQEALEQLQASRQPSEAILVKGSRGVAMEQIVAGLREAA